MDIALKNVARFKTFMYEFSKGEDYRLIMLQTLFQNNKDPNHGWILSTMYWFNLVWQVVGVMFGYLVLLRAKEVILWNSHSITSWKYEDNDIIETSKSYMQLE